MAVWLWNELRSEVQAHIVGRGTGRLDFYFPGFATTLVVSGMYDVDTDLFLREAQRRQQRSAADGPLIFLATRLDTEGRSDIAQRLRDEVSDQGPPRPDTAYGRLHDWTGPPLLDHHDFRTNLRALCEGLRPIVSVPPTNAGGAIRFATSSRPCLDLTSSVGREIGVTVAWAEWVTGGASSLEAIVDDLCLYLDPPKPPPERSEASLEAFPPSLARHVLTAAKNNDRNVVLVLVGVRRPHANDEAIAFVHALLRYVANGTFSNQIGVVLLGCEHDKPMANVSPNADEAVWRQDALKVLTDTIGDPGAVQPLLDHVLTAWPDCDEVCERLSQILVEVAHG